MTTHLRVLVVEDSDDDTSMLLRLFKQGGYEVEYERVETAPAMAAALSKREWDIVVSDFTMPQFSGLAALSQLQATGLDIPFILISGTIGEDLAVAAMKAGAQDYLLKDKLTKLVPTVARELADAQVRRQHREALEALKQSEERFRALIENSSDGITLINADLKTIYISQSDSRISGYSRDELLGKGPRFENVYPDDQATVQSIFQQVMQKPDEIVKAQYRFRHKDGSWRWLDVTAKNLIDNPSVQAIIVNYRDITERIEADRLLRESEEHYRLLFENNPLPMWVYDTATLRFLAVNEAAVKNYGYPLDEFLGMTIRDIRPEEELDQLDVSLAGEESQQRSGPWRHRKRDGSLIDVEIISHDILFLNRPARLVLANDITEALKAEEAVRNSEQKFRSLFAAMTDVILVLDEEGRFLEIAPTNAVNLYRPAEDMLGKKVADVFPPEQANFFLEHIRRTLQTKKITSAEYRLRIAQEEVWFSASVSSLSPNSVIWIAHNITERKFAEEKIHRQLEYLRALSEIDQIISSSFDLNIILKNVLSRAVSQLGVDAADMLLFNSTTQMLEYSTGLGFRTNAIEQSHLRLGEGYAGLAALDRNLLHIPDLTADGQNPRLAKLLAEEHFTGYWAVPLFAKGQIKGVLEIFRRESLQPAPEWLDFLKALAEQAAIAIDNATLFEGLQRSNTELRLAYDATIEGWSRALDLRDEETEGHTRRVTEITVRLSSLFNISEEEQIGVRWGALLHDIGKMGVPDGILLKPGPLTEEEWVVMAKHPTFAFEMLSPIRYLRSALDIPYCHHEKWDGTGYPRGLKGEDIPLAARIFAVVDVWDALSSDRPYRPAWTAEKVYEHIRFLAGTHFDPKVVKACLESGLLSMQKNESSPPGLDDRRIHSVQPG